MKKNLTSRITGRIWCILFDDIEFILLNYFVAYIPNWTIRKLIYKICGLKIGKGSRIAMKCIIMRPSKITVGENTVINEFVLLDGRDGLLIGDNNSISMYSKLYTGTHKTYSEIFEYLGKETVIKDNCWIGASAIVMPGSILNNFAIVSANSVFKGNAEEKGIYVGVPAKFVKKREIDNKYSLKYHSWFR